MASFGRRAAAASSLMIEELSNPEDPDHELNERGGLLPGPDATLAGPTFEEWLGAFASPGSQSSPTESTAVAVDLRCGMGTGPPL